MSSDALFEQIRTKQVTKDHIKQFINYVKQNRFENLTLTDTEKDTVATNIMTMITNYQNKRNSMGCFLNYVINNNLKSAILNADSTNLKALPIYTAFLSWAAPADMIYQLQNSPY